MGMKNESPNITKPKSKLSLLIHFNFWMSNKNKKRNKLMRMSGKNKMRRNERFAFQFRELLCTETHKRPSFLSACLPHIILFMFIMSSHHVVCKTDLWFLISIRFADACKRRGIHVTSILSLSPHASSPSSSFLMPF
jgi:hypothetical protein